MVLQALCADLPSTGLLPDLQPRSGNLLREARHIASGDGVASKDDESLYHVTQFADIAWPTFLL